MPSILRSHAAPIPKVSPSKKRRLNGFSNHDRQPKRIDSKYNSEDGEDIDLPESPDSNVSNGFQHELLPLQYEIPSMQERLLLHATKQRFQLDHTYQIPHPMEDDEVLVKVTHIGLNSIDWKSADFGWGIPYLPYLAGREFVGQIVSAPAKGKTSTSRTFRKGDIVFSASTDYRDRRKAAFQEYTIASTYNLSRIPVTVSHKSTVASLGVAFVSAAIVMGVCLGCDFSNVHIDAPAGPDLRAILRSMLSEKIPLDVRDEALTSIEGHERPIKGDWLAIWGGSSAIAGIISQLAKLLGLRVLKVVDAAKHGERLSAGSSDLIVDSYDPERAVEIIRRVTRGGLRFGIDTVGKTTAESLRKTLKNGDMVQRSHIVGLTGLPKPPVDGIKQHSMPIKLFHEVPQVGEAMMVWLEKLLSAGLIVPPENEMMEGGLSAVNEGLDRMRRGDVAGKRLGVILN